MIETTLETFKDHEHTNFWSFYLNYINYANIAVPVGCFSYVTVSVGYTTFVHSLTL